MGDEKLKPSVEDTASRLEVAWSNQIMVTFPFGATTNCADVARPGFTGVEKVTPPFVEWLKKLFGTLLVGVSSRCQSRLILPFPSKPI